MLLRCGDLRCFVVRQFLSQIYALLSVKYSGLKICWCKKRDKYQVWVDRGFDHKKVITVNFRERPPCHV